MDKITKALEDLKQALKDCDAVSRVTITITLSKSTKA